MTDSVKPKKDPNGGRRFLAFQRNEVVDNRQYVAGEVPNQWFAPNRVEQLVSEGAARVATEEEIQAAIAAGGKGLQHILPARTEPLGTTSSAATTGDQRTAFSGPTTSIPSVAELADRMKLGQAQLDSSELSKALDDDSK